MKILFDQNLAPSLARHFEAVYPGSVHVQDLGLERADDLTILRRARQDGSKDGDFADIQAALGHPPKLIWIVAGNVTTDQILRKLEEASEALIQLEGDPALGFVELA